MCNGMHVHLNLFWCYSERKEFLLLAQRDRIVRFDLKNPVLEVLPIRGLQNVIAVDFDIHNNCVYWADIITDTISVSNVLKIMYPVRINYTEQACVMVITFRWYFHF